MRLKLAGLVCAGLFLALAGCTTMISDGGPGPASAPPPGRPWGWGQPGPRLSVIADTGIQFVVDTDEDIFLNAGIWYRHSGDAWFSCGTYGGRWTAVREPPPVFYRIPPGHAKYRVVKGRPGPGPGGPRDKDDDKPGRGKGPWR